MIQSTESSFLQANARERRHVELQQELEEVRNLAAQREKALTDKMEQLQAGRCSWSGLPYADSRLRRIKTTRWLQLSRGQDERQLAKKNQG
jgi:hypothetical protein